MFIETITMDDFEQGLKKTQTVIIPFGSTEEHGSHLPLGTDTIHCYELAKCVSEKIPVFVCPPVYYGLCKSSSKHPGTIGISGTTLRHIVIDLVQSLYKQGLRRFLLFSGHAGRTHMAMITDAAEEMLESLPEIAIAVVSILDLGNEAWKGIMECAGDSHAGEVETSVMMELRPKWVKGTSPEEYPTFPKFLLVKNKKSFWPGGVWGDPGKASKEKGKIFLNRSMDKLFKIINDLGNIPLSKPSETDEYELYMGT